MEESLTFTATKGAYSVIFATFLQESIGHMIPWLVVTFCVILCDLVVGIRKSLILGEEVRFSTACRRSIGKTVSYYTFVVMAAVIDVAANGGGMIDKWACLMVCFIEGCSIVSNILKPKGYNINLVKMIAVIFSKKFDVAKQDVEEIIEKEDGRRN
jgi:phage-related holin